MPRPSVPCENILISYYFLNGLLLTLKRNNKLEKVANVIINNFATVIFYFRTKFRPLGPFDVAFATV
jgi:hypothetical protein